MPRVGLVLGAGGYVGQAYEIGALSALHWDLGWDPRSADVIVGTSAGSVTAALLGLGVPVLEMASWALGRPHEGEAVLDELRRLREGLPPLDARVLMRPWRVPGRETWSRALTRPWSLDPVATLSSILPAGTVPLADLVSRCLPEMAAREWPEQVRVCATRRNGCRRTVFGGPSSPSRGPARPASLPVAVAASCAIPAFFRPVVIDGEEYVDGGVTSPTNADVVVDDDLDLVVVVSPMSQAPGPLRGLARRRLRAECQALRAAGAGVVCFEPGRRTAALMGLNPMAPDRAPEVLPAAFFETGAAAGEPGVRDRLVAIDNRARQRPAA